MKRFQTILLFIYLVSLVHSMCFCQVPAQVQFLKKQFTHAGMELEPFCMTADRKNGYLIGADYYFPVTNTFVSKTTCLVHIDENGCVTWSTSLKTGEEEVIQCMISTSDSGFLVSAFPFQSPTSNYPTYLLVFKLDKDGNLVWSKNYSAGSSVNNYLSAICETTDHGFLLETGSFPIGNNPSFMSFIKLDQQGGFIWGRRVSMESNAVYNVGGMSEKNGFIYATGSISQYESPYRLIRSFLTKIDLNTGQISWTSQNSSESAVRFTDVHDYKNGILINSYDLNLFNHFIYTDDDGILQSASIVHNPYGSLNGRGNLIVTASNDLYFHQSSASSGTSRKEIIMRLDSNQKIVWQYDYFNQDRSYVATGQLCANLSDGLASLGFGATTDGWNAISLLSIDSTGAFCNTGNSNLNITESDFAFMPMDWNINTSLALTISDQPQLLSPLAIDAILLCPNMVTSCDTMTLKGPFTICRLGDTANYALLKDPACRDSVSWIYDSLNISVLSFNSESLVVHFRNEGVYTIKAIKRGCNILADSLQVVVGNGTGVHLPNDTTLCFGGSVILDAGSGYKNYQWQNGSDQQSIRVTIPGTYWVKVETANDCMYTDTTTIPFIVPLPSHFLPGDTLFCASESFLIQPLQTFSSYLWSTGETTASIRITEPGMFILQVLDKNGCMGSDTIRAGTRHCVFNIYFPNAFTPNQDGLNDQYKPVIVGIPVRYQFSIYNRLGQRLFATSDPKKGWDGTLAGKPQGNGAYVWACIYQFNGQRTIKTNGNLLLIR